MRTCRVAAWCFVLLGGLLGCATEALADRKLEFTQVVEYNTRAENHATCTLAVLLTEYQAGQWVGVSGSVTFTSDLSGSYWNPNSSSLSYTITTNSYGVGSADIASPDEGNATISISSTGADADPPVTITFAALAEPWVSARQPKHPTNNILHNLTNPFHCFGKYGHGASGTWKVHWWIKRTSQTTVIEHEVDAPGTTGNWEKAGFPTYNLDAAADWNFKAWLVKRNQFGVFVYEEGQDDVGNRPFQVGG